MASLARLIRHLISNALASDEDEGLGGQFSAFRTVLLHDLTEAEFSDMYAQTIAYGLFAARLNRADGSAFSRQEAAYSLPRTNPFLRRMFEQIAGPGLDVRIEWAVDQLAELLRTTQMSDITADFGVKSRREDPVLHFYETFLASYDPDLRERRGVYYTPEPVVSYIVSSVHELLRTEFSLPAGLGDCSTVRIPETRPGATRKTRDCHRVQILDPATGTGTFLRSVIQQIHSQVVADGQAGAWPDYVRSHLLPRLWGFELLMAPYAVAHMKLGLTLSETGYDVDSHERLGVFLTNALERAHEMSGLPLFAQWIAQEADAASELKQDVPVMVVLGNPPYSGHSENRGPWIQNLVDDYRSILGPNERLAQAKWLQDDYVKFIRFSEWRIARTGHGVLGFITNHSYLDSPTFRGMRLHLLKTFDRIFVLNLHGNVNRGETAPDGTVDRNVFDIQQGVAIALFVKSGRQSSDLAEIRYADLWGPRDRRWEGASESLGHGGGKYGWLAENNVATTAWNVVEPHAPHYLFLPTDAATLDEYHSGWSVAEVFAHPAKPTPGIVTTHDSFAISWDPEDMARKVETLLQTDNEAEARSIFKLCSQSQWSYSAAIDELSSVNWQDQLLPVTYRPFDRRWTVRNKHVAVHLRRRISDHLVAGENVALLTSRQTKGEPFAHVHASRLVPEVICLSSKTSNNAFAFPLYRYPEKAPSPLIPSGDSEPIRRHNLSNSLVTAICAAYDVGWVDDGSGDLVSTIGPEDVLHYVFAVLHAPSYRARFGDHLSRDFPRVPFVRDFGHFSTIANFGKKLLPLHLLESTQPAARFPFVVSGDNVVAKSRFTGSSHQAGVGRIWINQTQYFSEVPACVWEFRIGGYRVAEKWINSRAGRTLSYDDIVYFQRVLASLMEIDRLCAELDEAIADAGGWPFVDPVRAE